VTGSGEISPVFLTAPQYVLGEIEEDHTAIPHLSERVVEYGLVPKAEFWGWGTIRRTERSVTSMAVQTGAATLLQARVEPASVDCVVLCTTAFPSDNRDHGTFVAEVMTGIGLDDADFIGVGLHRCANLLAGIRTGEAMVASGRHRRVLVISTDRIEDESLRLEKFAMFSDGAASCLLSDSDPGGGYEVVSSAAAHNVSQLDWASELSADLSQRVNESLLKGRGLALADVALLHGNIFKPIVMLKEMQAGFRPSQLFTDNIARFGHCFAADPLINLVDRATAGHVRAGAYYMLASSVQGSRIGVLLRATA
jgi:3-oxoacyl-[acyl-carrier-protein] synthase-3